MPARPSWARKVATTQRGSVHWRKPFVPQRFQGGSQRPRRRRDRALAGARWPSGSRGKEGARGGTMGFPRAKPRRRPKAGLRVRGGVEDAVRTALHLEDEMGLAQRRVAGLEGI